MSIMLITGVPGAGKTLRQVQEAADSVGRLIYSNIEGLTIPHEPLPDDWRECEDGSLLLIDEVHQMWPATGKPGQSTDATINALDEHRHKGLDFILATQYPRKVHHIVRDLVDRHLHVYRLAGAPAATIYEWPHVESNPNDRANRDAADNYQWKYPKKLYKAYKSATVHTQAYKFRMPTKIKLAMMGVLGIGFYVFTTISSNENGILNQMFSDDEYTSTTTTSPQRTVLVSSTADKTYKDMALDTKTPVVMGCISNKTKCMCYGESGQVLDQSYEQCRHLLTKPLPIRARASKKES